jgi:hypothetical protein
LQFDPFLWRIKSIQHEEMHHAPWSVVVIGGGTAASGICRRVDLGSGLCGLGYLRASRIAHNRLSYWLLGASRGWGGYASWPKVLEVEARSPTPQVVCLGPGGKKKETADLESNTQHTANTGT